MIHWLNSNIYFANLQVTPSVPAFLPVDFIHNPQVKSVVKQQPQEGHVTMAIRQEKGLSVLLIYMCVKHY